MAGGVFVMRLALKWDSLWCLPLALGRCRKRTSGSKEGGRHGPLPTALHPALPYMYVSAPAHLRTCAPVVVSLLPLARAVLQVHHRCKPCTIILEILT
ncbi:hypothetical protein V8C86DRAFT_2647368 [Haematococcus lacustris]